MAQIINTNTSLSRRAAAHWVWLVGMWVLFFLLLAGLGRSIVMDMGGPQHIRQVGARAAASASLTRAVAESRVGSTHIDLARRLAVPAAHLVALVLLAQFLSLPWVVIRARRGEQAVLDELSRLPDDYYVLSNLVVPAETRPASVDHVVVSPYGVWCIETKPHSGYIRGGETDFDWRQYKRQGDTERPCHRFFNPIRQNTTNCAAVANYLSNQRLNIPVAPMVVFTSAELDLMAMTPVETTETMRAGILTRDTEQTLDDRQIQQAVGALSELVAAAAPRRRHTSLACSA